MKTKKLICIICCLVLVFTLLSGPWRAEAEAAGAATIVLAIVGTFIVSAGFSFATKGEFQSATDAFMKSDAAKYVTEITGYVNDVMSLGNANNIYDLAPLITSDWFQAFWQSIRDFFGDHEVEVDNGIPSAPEGWAYYNGICLPELGTLNTSNYPKSIITILDDGYYRFVPISSSRTVYYNPSTGRVHANGSLSWYRAYPYNIDSSSTWVKYDSVTSGCNFDLNTVVWSGADIYSSDGTTLIFEGTEVITEGVDDTDIISVNEDTNYLNSDVVGSWVTKANEGAIDWALDSSTVYQDVTASDTTAAMTATQTGVLTDAGVAVESISDTMSDYAVPGLASIFPFCIPFDVYNFLSVLTAEREAPHFEFLLDFGNLGSHTVEVDLSEWETVATILRTIELLGFCVGLALATSKLIKW